MQNITTTNNGNNVTTYSTFDYTVEYAVSIMAFDNRYMVYGAVHHEDYSVYVENDNICGYATDAFEELKHDAFIRLNEHDACKMCELLNELVRMWSDC